MGGRERSALTSSGARRGVLVTGGSGVIGSAVVHRLAAAGYPVWATTTLRPAADAAGVAWIRWDAVAEPEPIVPWDRIRCIVHLAAPRHPLSETGTTGALYATAVAGTRNLLARAEAAGIPRFLYASTGDVLTPNGAAAREDDRTYSAATPYAAAKAAGELLTLGHGAPPSSAVVRIFHPYGPGGDRFVVNRMITAITEGREITVESPDGIELNPIWIEDLAEGIVRAVLSDATGVFHLAGPDRIAFGAMLRLMAKLMNRAPRIHIGAPGRPGQHLGNCARARAILGFAPRVSLREGLERLCGHVLDTESSAKGVLP